jgi:hypothetical protein
VVLPRADYDAFLKRGDDAAEDADDGAIYDTQKAERPRVALGVIRPCSPRPRWTRPQPAIVFPAIVFNLRDRFEFALPVNGATRTIGRWGCQTQRGIAVRRIANDDREMVRGERR